MTKLVLSPRKKIQFALEHPRRCRVNGNQFKATNLLPFSDSGNQTWFQVTWMESTGYQESGLIFKIKAGTRPKNILKNQTQNQITLWNWNWNQNSSNLFFRARTRGIRFISKVTKEELGFDLSFDSFLAYQLSTKFTKMIETRYQMPYWKFYDYLFMA